MVTAGFDFLTFQSNGQLLIFDIQIKQREKSLKAISRTWLVLCIDKRGRV